MKTSLKKDVFSVFGGIESLNTIGAIGYLFNATKDGNGVENGMFIYWEDEIDKKHWQFFYNSKINSFEKLK